MKNLIVSLAFAALVGACSEFDSRQPQVAIPPAQAATGTINAESALPDESSSTEPRVLSVPARKPKPSEEQKEVDPDQLVGLDRDGVLDLLGRPALEEESSPAKIWVYNGKICALHVFFYPEITTKEFEVLTYEIRNVEADENARRDCIEEVLQANAAG